MTENKPDILIVEDEKSIRDALSLSLSDRYDLTMAGDGKTALQLITDRRFDAALLDIRLPEINGLELLERLKKKDSSTPVVMITAVKTVESAVKAMKLGAADYIIKPFDINELRALLEKVLSGKKLKKDMVYLDGLAADNGFEKIIGNSEKMKEVFSLITNVARSDSTILLTGESGTGKEMVANAIHNLSNRANKLFVPVNCAAIPENLLESELFGYEKGAFTGAYERHLGKFEIANSGTIFLDEIGLLPLPMQAKLLRVLQEKHIDRVGGTSPVEINVRVIAATNADLKAEVEDKKFRGDLFYRLNVIPIHIPPLRERNGDLPLLINYFLNKYNREFSRSVTAFSKEALASLVGYDWPGNVRELENLIERLVVLSEKDMIPNEMLPPEISRSKSTFKDIMKEHAESFEMDLIKKINSKANLNDRQMKALEMVRSEGKITKQRYIRLNNTTKTTAFRDLNSLVKLNMLDQKGIGKSSYYTLP